VGLPIMLSFILAGILPTAPTLVVAPLQSSHGDQADATTMTRLVRIYAGQAHAFTLVTPEELGAIDEELKRQLSGGCNDDSCIADIGGALGAQYMITGSLDRLGKRHILTLKLIDIEQVRAVSTVAAQAKSVEEFADSLPGKMRALFDGAERKGSSQAAAASKPTGKTLSSSTAKAEPAAKPKPMLGSQKRPAKSCLEIKRKYKKSKDNVYWLRPSLKGGAFVAYCDMKTAGGGWTLVMSIDGRKKTFVYDSPYWTNRKRLNEYLKGKPPFEYKGKGFYRVSFSEVNLVTQAGKDLRNLRIKQSAKSLYHLLRSGKYRGTKLGRKKWKSLLKNSSLQRKCNREGFNVHNALMRVRIGIIANQENDCKTPDSRLGFGAGSNDPKRGPSRAVGNEAIGFEPDKGKRQTTAWGFILVR
jgi:hypothetical protein